MTGATFVYDGLGRRQKKTIGVSPTEFLYDGVNPVQETDGPTILANILGGLGIDEVFVRTGSTGARNFLTDALGSTIALTDTAGTVQTEYTYEPFGGTTATGLASTNSYQYTGRENDGTGLYYYRERYYHPTFQRFVSEDPLNLATAQLVRQATPELAFIQALLQQNPELLNLYAYVANNPLLYIDPFGLIRGLDDNDPASPCSMNPNVKCPSDPPPGGGRKDPKPKPPKPLPSPPDPELERATRRQACELVIGGICAVLTGDNPLFFPPCAAAGSAICAGLYPDTQPIPFPRPRK